MFIYIYHMYVCIVSSFPKQKTIFGEKWYKRHFRKTFTHKNLKILQENSFWPRARREVLVVTLMTQKKKKKKTFIFWTLEIDSKSLGKFFGHIVDNLEETWRRFIDREVLVVTLMTQKKLKKNFCFLNA